MDAFVRLVQGRDGQGTVEAAFVIPVLFLAMLIVLQPGIILYDKIVMNNAAAEACRLLATMDASGDGAQGIDDFVKHRLGAIPPHEFFHVHKGGCTWDIECEGGESSGVASVSIETDVRPLPLFDATFSLLGVSNGSGFLHIGVKRSSSEQPGWALSSVSGSPADWVGAWCQ